MEYRTNRKTSLVKGTWKKAGMRNEEIGRWSEAKKEVAYFKR